MAPCRGVHRHANRVRHRLGRLGEFMEVRREQRAAAHHVIVILHAGLSDRQAIMGRGAAAI